MRGTSVESFVQKYTEEVRQGTAAVFAGAGLSRAAGYVDWEGLLRPLAKDIDLRVEREYDLISLAQYYVNDKGGRGSIDQEIVNRFSGGAEVTRSHQILASLPIRSYWTTNYDGMIETALERAGKTPDVKIEPENLAVTKPRRDAVVYKMHGDVSQAHKAVISKDDYEGYEKERGLFSINLQGDLVSKTFLFVGFSFNDPNLGLILSRIRRLLGQNRRDHYALFKRVRRSDYTEHSDEENEREFLYQQVLEQHRVVDLKRYGIQTVFVDTYDEIPVVLQSILNRYRRRNVFISGAAEDYGRWSKEEALRFVHDLSYGVLEREDRVLSGFGVDVGTAVINGALSFIHGSQYRHLDEYLTLRPFPQFQTSDEPIRDSWKRYRQDMLSESGVALFVFGNKRLDTGEIVESEGMVEEFEVGLEHSVVPVPIGATGFASKTIWERVMSDPAHYYGDDDALATLIGSLGDETLTLDQLRYQVSKTLSHLRS